MGTNERTQHVNEARIREIRTSHHFLTSTCFSSRAFLCKRCHCQPSLSHQSEIFYKPHTLPKFRTHTQQEQTPLEIDLKGLGNRPKNTSSFHSFHSSHSTENKLACFHCHRNLLSFTPCTNGPAREMTENPSDILARAAAQSTGPFILHKK